MFAKLGRMSLSSAASSPARPNLTADQFQQFSDLIYDLSGIRFQESKNYFLAAKIAARCQDVGVENPTDYYQFLQSPSGRTEYGHLIDAITINETFFYRNQPQLQAFEQEVLIPLINHRRQQGQRKIRIWSCASSTGDELYTILLMLTVGGYANDIEVELVGSDICSQAVAAAKNGVYRQYSIRNVPTSQLQQYFDHDDHAMTWTLKPDLRQKARFQECNLMDETRTQALGKFDIIFCRNVLIYFDDKSKEQVVKNIANVLTEDGVVILGHSENIYSQRHLLKADKQRTASIAHIKAPPGTEKYNV